MRLPQIMTPRGRFLPLVTRPGLRGGGQQGVILPPDALPAPASGGIKQITSIDSSIVVTAPTGPTTDLALPGNVVRMGQINEDGEYFSVIGNGAAANGYATTVAAEGTGNGGVLISATSSLVKISSGTGVNLAAGILYFGKDASSNYTIQWGSGGITGGKSIFINGDSSAQLLQIDADGGHTVFLRRSVAHLTVKDENGNALFRVDHNGDLHGVTGKALTFDL